jgi:hypothetical protein
MSMPGSSESSVITMGVITAATTPASTNAPATSLTIRRELAKKTPAAMATTPRSISELTHHGYHQLSRSIATVIGSTSSP